MTKLLQDLSLLLELCLVAGETDNLESFSEKFVQRAVSKTCSANGLLFIRRDLLDADPRVANRTYIPFPSSRARYLVGAPELDGVASGIEAAIARGGPALLPGDQGAAHRAQRDVLPPPFLTLQVPLRDVGVLELYARTPDVLDEHVGRVLASLSAWLAGVIRGFAARIAIRMRAEALERNRQSFLELSGILPGVPWITDGWGRIQLLGHRVEEVFGRKVPPDGEIATLREAGLAPTDRHRVRRAMAEALAERKDRAWISYLYAPESGPPVEIAEDIHFSFDAEGRPERIVGFASRASAPAETSDLPSSEVLGALIHEMRGALFPVIALSDLMLQTPDAVSGEWREQIERIAAAGHRQLELLADTSDLARAEGGRLRPRLGPCDLFHVMQALSGTLGEKARRDGLDVRIEARPSPAAVYSERAIITRVAECLVGHAISVPRATSAKLTAEVDVAAFCVRLRMTYIDPMPPTDPASLWSPFWDPSSRKEPAGKQARKEARGLGLFVAARMLAVLGGRTIASTDGDHMILDAEVPCALPREAPVAEIAGRRVLVLYRRLPIAFRASLVLASMGGEVSMLPLNERSAQRDTPDFVFVEGAQPGPRELELLSVVAALERGRTEALSSLLESIS